MLLYVFYVLYVDSVYVCNKNAQNYHPFLRVIFPVSWPILLDIFTSSVKPLLVFSMEIFYRNHICLFGMESLIFNREKNFWKNIVEKNHLKKKKLASNACELVDFRLPDPHQAFHKGNAAILAMKRNDKPIVWRKLQK